jgi:ABC-2 type transport system permease protein
MMDHLRTLRLSAWLGWQIESNWTEPWLFAVYVLFKPLCGSFLLVCMYWAVQGATDNGVPTAFLPFMYVSNACYMLVGAVMFGLSWVVISDREHYRMLKYIYISPVRLRSYLAGRGLARAAEAVLGALLTLGIGVLLLPDLGEALGRHATDWGWLCVYLGIGTVMLLALGLILAGAVLNMPRHAMFLSEGIAGTLYLLSGVVFPISQLPPWLRPVSLGLPVTYWLEGMRRALLGRDLLGETSVLARWDDAHLAIMLLVTTLGLVAFAHFFFRWSERRAWRLGRLDESTGM